MSKSNLDERCAELKARMTTGRSTSEEISAPVTAADRKHLKSDPRPAAESSPPSPPSVEIRNPHPLVKAALEGVRDVPDDYGKLQFRHTGRLDIRATKPLVRRALKIMDTLLKRLNDSGLQVQLQPHDRGYHGTLRRYTNVMKGNERVQITITEKTVQRTNPAWSDGKDWRIKRYVYDASGRLTLVLDDDDYGWSYDWPRRWSDAKGHLVEEYIDDAVSSIRQTLEAKRQASIRRQEERRREVERQEVRAEEQRQEREEERRIADLKQQAQAWFECERLRAFVAACEKQLGADGEGIAPGSELDGWRRWASRAADRLDPLIDE